MLKLILAKTDTWWNKLTRPQQDVYIQRHPNSKYAKEKKALEDEAVNKQSKETQDQPAKKSGGWFDKLNEKQLEKYIANHPKSKKAKELLDAIKNGKPVPEAQEVPMPTEKPKKSWLDTLKPHQLDKYIKKHPNSKIAKELQSKNAVDAFKQMQKKPDETKEKSLEKPSEPVKEAPKVENSLEQLNNTISKISNLKKDTEAKALELQEKYLDLMANSDIETAKQVYTKMKEAEALGKKIGNELKELVEKRDAIKAQKVPVSKSYDAAKWNKVKENQNPLKALENGGRIVAPSEPERSALKEYTGSEYLIVNRLLRDSTANSDSSPAVQAKQKALVNKIVSGLDTVFAKADPTKEDLVVNRGIKNRDFLENLEVDSILSDGGYTSTSTGYGFGAPVTGAKLQILIPKGSKNAINVSKYSEFPEEEEILINRNAKMKVVKINKEIEPWEITLELVND